MNTLLNPDTCPYTDQDCNTHAQCACCLANGTIEMEFLKALLSFKREHSFSLAMISRITGLSPSTVKRAFAGKRLSPLTVSKLYHMMWYYGGQ